MSGDGVPVNILVDGDGASRARRPLASGHVFELSIGDEPGGARTMAGTDCSRLAAAAALILALASGVRGTVAQMTISPCEGNKRGQVDLDVPAGEVELISDGHSAKVSGKTGMCAGCASPKEVACCWWLRSATESFCFPWRLPPLSASRRGRRRSARMERLGGSGPPP